MEDKIIELIIAVIMGGLALIVLFRREWYWQFQEYLLRQQGLERTYEPDRTCTDIVLTLFALFFLAGSVIVILGIFCWSGSQGI